MLPPELQEKLTAEIARAEYPQEKAIDVMYALQDHFGYMNEEAMQEASQLLGMTTLELDELATFYDFIYREPVGKYVIHICDSAICWLNGHESLVDHLCRRLDIPLGGTTADGLFSLLPVCCIGYCDHAPAMLINRKVYGFLTTEKIDRILRQLTDQANSSKPD